MMGGYPETDLETENRLLRELESARKPLKRWQRRTLTMAYSHAANLVLIFLAFVFLENPSGLVRTGLQVLVGVFAIHTCLLGFCILKLNRHHALRDRAGRNWMDYRDYGVLHDRPATHIEE